MKSEKKEKKNEKKKKKKAGKTATRVEILDDDPSTCTGYRCYQFDRLISKTDPKMNNNRIEHLLSL